MREAGYDSELYVAGNMKIWSKGSKSQALAVYKVFTVDSLVQQALGCDFIVSQATCEKAHSRLQQKNACVYLQALVSCIVRKERFTVCFPFQVANVLPTKYWLLFQRSSSSQGCL